MQLRYAERYLRSHETTTTEDVKQKKSNKSIYRGNLFSFKLHNF